jgi:hypothetical protein
MMDTEKIWKFIERFKTILEAIASLVVIVPVLIVLAQQGLTAVIPVWLVVLIVTFSVLLGFLLGRRPQTVPADIKSHQNRTLIDTITFNYLDSPTKHGWEVWESNDETQPKLKRVSDGFFGNVLEVRSTIRYAMDLNVSPAAQAGTMIEYTAKLEQDYGLYALVSVQSKDGSKTENVWFNFQIGLAQPEPLGEGHGEWKIFITPEQIGGNWLLFRADLIDIIVHTVGSNGWSYRKLKRIRLRGNLSLAHIKIYQ